MSAVSAQTIQGGLAQLKRHAIEESSHWVPFLSARYGERTIVCAKLATEIHGYYLDKINTMLPQHPAPLPAKSDDTRCQHCGKDNCTTCHNSIVFE